MKTKSKTRSYKLNMPHMAMGGISELWMNKEFGDIHWEMICDKFGCESDAFIDQGGNRLYASFVRIKYEASEPLQQFKENEKLKITPALSRFGSKMFFSTQKVTCGEKILDGSMMSIFVSRATGNESLTKGTPINQSIGNIDTYEALPPFAKEYLDLKNNEQEPNRPESILFSHLYTINPQHDINGVNLLYFAAYPMINDTCENVYFKKVAEENKITGNWLLQTSVRSRDTYYFGNCNVDDLIRYELNSCEFMENYRVKISSSLIRHKDNVKIAKLITVRDLITI
jgi:probable biosynthetic protein (TIGR04098 family)